MIANIPLKGVSFSDFICIFAMSVEDLFDLISTLNHGKILNNFLLLRCAYEKD